jgi:hypothetical protein
VSFTPWPFYPPVKGPHFPLDRGLGGTKNRSRRHGEEENPAPTGTRTPAPLPFILSLHAEPLEELKHVVRTCSVVACGISVRDLGTAPSDKSQAFHS